MSSELASPDCPKCRQPMRLVYYIPRSLHDLDGKLRSKAYYRAHGQWFIEEIDHICDSVPQGLVGPVEEQSYRDVMGFARKVLFDSVYLFREWGIRNNRPDLCRLGKNEESHVMHFYQGTRQVIYGPGTFGLSFNDNHSDLAIGVIRQLVEIRIRRATGIMWKTELRMEPFIQFP
jgi:hypothetical protein